MKLIYIDYAVYGDVIVPMYWCGFDALVGIYKDEESGKCRVISHRREKSR